MEDGKSMPANMLRAAAELLREKGHCKNKLSDEDGRHCLMGALSAVMDVTEFSGAAWDSILFTVREQFPDRTTGSGFDPVDFNNDPDTTGDEVAAVLEKAAVRLEEAAE